jgi:hypothetical protein
VKTLDDFTVPVTTPNVASASTSPGSWHLSPPTTSITRPVQDPDLVDRIASVALDIAERVGVVTADDVRQTMPNAPRSKAFGAAFSKLVNEKKLLPGQYKPSTVPSSHGRRIRVYHLRHVHACLGPEHTAGVNA